MRLGAGALERTLERFLQLARRATSAWPTCTTPAQYFHLLRRQALCRSRGADRDDAEEPARLPAAS